MRQSTTRGTGSLRSGGTSAKLAKLSESDPATSVTRERWLLPLFQELGYGRLIAAKPLTVDEKTYAVSHAWQKTLIHLVGFRADLDRRGGQTASPHGLVQEFLNRSDGHLWAFLSNGRRLRILRDNASLTRQAFVEFDIEAMMDGEVYADFSLLWLVCHELRVPVENPADCWLERWSKRVQDQGTRALDQLRAGVETAITALGRGFLDQPANSAAPRRPAGRAADPPGLLPPAATNRLPPALPVCRRGSGRFCSTPALPKRPGAASPISTQPLACGVWPNGDGGLVTSTCISA